MYFSGCDFEQGGFEAIHISYVANRIVYVEREVRRTSYYLTDDGYNLLLGTLEVESNLKLTIQELIFQMHLEKQSYDKALDDIKNVFNLMQIQLQKIREAMLRIRRNVLDYRVGDYERLLRDDLATIDETKEKFRHYRELVQSRVREMEAGSVDVQVLLPDVHIFKEVMVELLKAASLDIEALRRERAAYIREEAKDFRLSAMVLDILDEHPAWGRIRCIEVQKLCEAPPVIFRGVPDGAGGERVVRCSEVVLRVQGARELYRAYTEFEPVQEMVKAQGRIAASRVKRYGDAVYLIPEPDNDFLGYTCAHLKKELCRSNATDKDYYLAQFAILVLLLEFYDGQGASSKTRDYIRVGELQNSISERLREGAELAAEEQEAQGLAYQDMLEAYESLRSDDRGTAQLGGGRSHARPTRLLHERDRPPRRAGGG